MLLSDMLLAPESFWGKISQVLDTSPEISLSTHGMISLEHLTLP